MSKRTHKTRVEASRNLTPEQIRRNKCERSRTRNESRRAERLSIINEREQRWRNLSASAQLDELDKRLGKNLGAVKQRRRICETIASEMQQSDKSQSQTQGKTPHSKNRRKRSTKSVGQTPSK